MNSHTFKHSALTARPLESQPETRELCDRTERLYSSGKLDPFEVEILNLLDRVTVLSPIELQYLEMIESKYDLD